MIRLLRITRVCKECGFETGIHTDEKVKEPTKCKKCKLPFTVNKKSQKPNAE
jgi:predicted Zn-ribbon and HTH transcriptional regulator